MEVNGIYNDIKNKYYDGEHPDNSYELQRVSSLMPQVSTQIINGLRSAHKIGETVTDAEIKLMIKSAYKDSTKIFKQLFNPFDCEKLYRYPSLFGQKSHAWTHEATYNFTAVGGNLRIQWCPFYNNSYGSAFAAGWGTPLSTPTGPDWNGYFEPDSTVWVSEIRYGMDDFSEAFDYLNQSPLKAGLRITYIGPFDETSGIIEVASNYGRKSSALYNKPLDLIDYKRSDRHTQYSLSDGCELVWLPTTEDELRVGSRKENSSFSGFFDIAITGAPTHVGAFRVDIIYGVQAPVISGFHNVFSPQRPPHGTVRDHFKTMSQFSANRTSPASHTYENRKQKRSLIQRMGNWFQSLVGGPGAFGMEVGKHMLGFDDDRMKELKRVSREEGVKEAITQTYNQVKSKVEPFLELGSLM